MYQMHTVARIYYIELLTRTVPNRPDEIPSRDHYFRMYPAHT